MVYGDRIIIISVTWFMVPDVAIVAVVSIGGRRGLVVRSRFRTSRACGRRLRRRTRPGEPIERTDERGRRRGRLHASSVDFSRKRRVASARDRTCLLQLILQLLLQILRLLQLLSTITIPRVFIRVTHEPSIRGLTWLPLYRTNFQ